MNKISEIIPNISTIVVISLILSEGEGSLVKHECYVISIFNLLFSLFYLMYIFYSSKNMDKNMEKFFDNQTYYIFFIITSLVNFLYSIFVIHYYINKKIVDRNMMGISVSSLTLECIDTVFALCNVKK